MPGQADGGIVWMNGRSKGWKNGCQLFLTKGSKGFDELAVINVITGGGDVVHRNEKLPNNGWK